MGKQSKTIKYLINKINRIGNDMVKCEIKCKGIINNPKEGVLPRCLFIDILKGSNNNGIIIVGLNPGKSGQNERNAYKIKKTYKNTIIMWKEYFYESRYYKILRRFVRLIGFKGPILWTELVKCEKQSNTNFPPLQTFRNCTSNYLRREMRIIPNDWPIIALGLEAYKALSYLYPKKTILGLPHPTGSRGQCSKIMKDKKLIKIIKTWLGNKDGKSFWASAKRKELV